MNAFRESFCGRGRGRPFHVDGLKTEKARKPTVESVVRGIRSRAGSTGGCVKLKTVTEIRRSSVRDTFIAECLSRTEFSVGLGASGKIEIEVWCGQFYVFFSEASSSVLYAKKTMDRGGRQARKERIAVVEAWQNEWGDQFHCSLGGKILPDRDNSTELLVAGSCGLTDEVLQSQREGLCYRQAEGCWLK